MYLGGYGKSNPVKFFESSGSNRVRAPRRYLNDHDFSRGDACVGSNSYGVISSWLNAGTER